MRKEHKNKLIKMLIIGGIILIAILIFAMFNKWGLMIAGIFVWGFGLILAGEDFGDDNWI